MSKLKVEAKMQTILDKLGIPLKVVWTPNLSHDKHGLLELSSGTLFLFDESEEEVWQTFIHEVLEFKLKEVLKHYRNVINSLIEVIEESCYEKKEEFLESVPSVFKVIEEENKREA